MILRRDVAVAARGIDLNATGGGGVVVMIFPSFTGGGRSDDRG